MSLTVNQSNGASGGSLSQAISISIPSPHTVGVWVYFDTFGNGGTISSVTDNAGNTYTLGKTATDGSRIVGTAWSIAVGSAITSVTVNTSGGTGGFCAILVWDVTATGTITASDSEAVHIGSASSATDGVSTGSIAVTSADALLLAGCTDTSSFALSIGTGFTADFAISPSLFISEHKAVTASAAATFTCSSAGDNVFASGLAFQVSGGGGVSANLTAQTATFTEGTLTRAVATALTGQTATFAEGTIAPTVSSPLNGQSATFSEGALAATIAPVLAGQTATFSLGVVTPSITYGVTGQTATFTEGTITATQGTVANLTAQTATFTLGTITPSISYALTGQTSTFTAGILGPQASYALSGQTAAFAEGSMTPALGYAVTGLSATFSEGTITPQAGGDVARSITGLTASFSLGIITVTGGDQPVTGDTHDGLPRRKRHYDDSAQTQVIRESALRPKKARPAKPDESAAITEPHKPSLVTDSPEDEESLLALIEIQDDEMFKQIELATHLLRTLH